MAELSLPLIRTETSRTAPRGRLATVAVIALAVLVALPILALLPAAFADSEGLWTHMLHTVLWSYVRDTLGLAFGVALVAGSIGVTCGWLMAVFRFPGDRILAWALILPLAFPAYILAFLYTDLLQFAGPVQTALRSATGWSRGDYWFPDPRTVPGASLILGLALYPYVYTLMRAAFAGQSASAIEAARLLGRPARTVFWRVALPIARPALVAGVTLVLMETFADYGAVTYFGIDTFTVGIYRAWFAFDTPAVAAQLALALLGCVWLALLLERFSRRDARFVPPVRGRPVARVHLRGWRGTLAVMACTLPLLAGFVLPALWLVHLTVDSAWGEHGMARLLTLGGNTLILAALAVGVILLAALLAAWSARLSGSRVSHLANRTAMLGYATPGAVIAVGLLLAIGAFDRAVDGAATALFGSGTGLVLGGTLVAVVYGLSARFFAVGYGAVDAGFNRIGPHMDAAARSLGAGPWSALARVHLPLLRPHLAMAAILVAVDVLKELPATMILRPFNFDTLAVEAYRYATTERLDAAALPALLIVVVGLLPVIILGRQARRLG
jgi:iron(III) transport system permease protein